MQKMSNDDIARAAVEIVEARVRAAADAEHAFEAMMSVVRPRLSRDAWRRGVLANAGVSEEQIASLRGEWALTPGLFEDSARYRHDVARMIEGTAGGYWGGPGPTLPRTPTSNVERVAIETARVGHSPWSVIMLALDDLRDDPIAVYASICEHIGADPSIRPEVVGARTNTTVPVPLTIPSCFPLSWAPARARAQEQPPGLAVPIP